MAKEDNSKHKAEKVLEKVLAHFHLYAWSPAAAMRMYPAGLLKIYEKNTALPTEIVLDQLVPSQSIS